MANVNIRAATGELVFSPPTERRALLSVASALIPGALVLANAQETRREALVLLLGHIAECLLKSIALKSANNEAKIKKKDVRHNLDELWKLAAKECSQLEKPIPMWVKALNRFHNKPYASRYMDKVAAYSLPEIEPVLEGVIFLRAFAEEFA